MNLNHHDRQLLIELRSGNHVKANPGNVTSILQSKFPDIPPTDILASYRRLMAEGVARDVTDSSRPGALLLRITDAGMAQADQLIEADRKPSWKERFVSLPVGKGIWDLVKIGLGFALGLLTHKLTTG